MRALVQRVSKASVAINGQEVGAIGQGLLVFLAVGTHDGDAEIAYIVEKVSNLRIFSDEAARFDRSLVDVGGALLVVSQFTLYADTRRGRRPSFSDAAPPAIASALFEQAVAQFRATGIRVETVRFQEMMEVTLINDGPVTILIDSADRLRPRK